MIEFLSEEDFPLLPAESFNPGFNEKGGSSLTKRPHQTASRNRLLFCSMSAWVFCCCVYM